MGIVTFPEGPNWKPRKLTDEELHEMKENYRLSNRGKESLKVVDKAEIKRLARPQK